VRPAIITYLTGALVCGPCFGPADARAFSERAVSEAFLILFILFLWIWIEKSGHKSLKSPFRVPSGNFIASFREVCELVKQVLVARGKSSSTGNRI
jgi:hypothetical protein